MDTKRLLIVEDELPIRILLERTLIEAGYEVGAVPDGPDALQHIKRHGLPHLILLDLGLPTMHGFDVAERVKKMGDVPIIILTADNEEESVVRGISEYAEDYVIKPLKPREVAARVKRVLSRISDYSYAAEPTMRVTDKFLIDFVNSALIIDGIRISLTPIETRLLSVLVKNSGHIVSTEQLFNRVWPNDVAYEETLRVHMARLRRKMGPYAGCIRTERGVGYIFECPDL